MENCVVDRVLLSYGLHLDLSYFIFIQKPVVKTHSSFFAYSISTNCPRAVLQSVFLNPAPSAMPALLALCHAWLAARCLKAHSGFGVCIHTLKSPEKVREEKGWMPCEIFVVWAENWRLRVLPFFFLRCLRQVISSADQAGCAVHTPVDPAATPVASNVFLGHCCWGQLSNSALCFQGS